jgi:hypothetical protein
VAIRASASTQIDALIADLGGGSAVTRETAIARLTLLGTRAVDRLIAVTAAGADADVRTAAWRTLEAIGDSRALQPALAALAAPDLEPAIAAAAAGVAHLHVRGAHGAAVVDRLAEVLLDRARHATVRLAALRGLRELDRSTIAPILASLADDPNATIRNEAGLGGPGAPRDHDHPAAVIMRAAEGRLPDDPATLRDALNLAESSVAPSMLQTVIARVREREGSESPEVRDQWRRSRAAAHVALAHRGSRVALYDLRESLETAKGPLPVEFLAAITLVGDASSVEAIAGAYAKATDDWWRQHLARAFRDIVARERLTRRHAAVKRIEKRWPGVLDELGAGRAGQAG